MFDVGETLVDETRLWREVAFSAGVPSFTFMGVLGGVIARGEHHRRVWEVLGIEPVPLDFEPEDFYPDALPCLRRLRDAGYRVGIAGNTPRSTEEMLRPHCDVVGSSERWETAKPSRSFFERLVAECGSTPGETVYIGDRVDNDVAPALSAGLIPVHIRRGPWGHLQQPPAGVLSIRGLDELPAALETLEAA